MDLHNLGTAKQSSEGCLGGIRGELERHGVDDREDVQESTATLRHNLRLHCHWCAGLEHDDTAQAVAAAGLRIDALVANLSDPAAREAAANARQALSEANKRLRRLLFELRPPALDESGLAAALEQYLLDGFGHDGLDWRVRNTLESEPSPETRAVLYRVALEALTNVRKHAGARAVEVHLERRGVGVALRVRDDGRGFDLPAPDAPPEPGRLGLVSMRERADAAGGRFALTSVPDGGTTVDFWMPEPNGRPSAEPPAA